MNCIDVIKIEHHELAFNTSLVFLSKNVFTAGNSSYLWLNKNVQALKAGWVCIVYVKWVAAWLSRQDLNLRGGKPHFTLRCRVWYLDIRRKWELVG